MNGDFILFLKIVFALAFVEIGLQKTYWKKRDKKTFFFLFVLSKRVKEEDGRILSRNYVQNMQFMWVWYERQKYRFLRMTESNRNKNKNRITKQGKCLTDHMKHTHTHTAFFQRRLIRSSVNAVWNCTPYTDRLSKTFNDLYPERKVPTKEQRENQKYFWHLHEKEYGIWKNVRKYKSRTASHRTAPDSIELVNFWFRHCFGTVNGSNRARIVMANPNSNIISYHIISCVFAY